MNPLFIEEMGWQMGEVYAAVTDRILINLARHFEYLTEGKLPSGGWDYQVRKLAELGQVTRETQAIILDSMKGGDAALANLLTETIIKSLEPIEKPLKDAAKKGLLLGGGFLPPEISPQMTQAFKAFYNQAADKMNLVNTVMLESTQDVYRQTVSDIAIRMERSQTILNQAAGEVVTGVSSMNEAVRGGVQKMIDNGRSSRISTRIFGLLKVLDADSVTHIYPSVKKVEIEGILTVLDGYTNELVGESLTAYLSIERRSECGGKKKVDTVLVCRTCEVFYYLPVLLAPYVYVVVVSK